MSLHFTCEQCGRLVLDEEEGTAELGLCHVCLDEGLDLSEQVGQDADLDEFEEDG